MAQLQAGLRRMEAMNTIIFEGVLYQQGAVNDTVFMLGKLICTKWAEKSTRFPYSRVTILNKMFASISGNKISLRS